MNANQEWDIRERSGACQSCARSFVDQEAFFTRLSFAEGNYVRQDFCAGCWNDSTRQGALSVWKGIFKVPAPPPPEPLKRETAESLLRQFMETEDVSKRNIIFILAVMLERKRVLVERDVQVRDDGVKIRIYEHRKTGESFVVPDPGLKLAELSLVQREVVDMLGGTSKQNAAPEPAAPKS